MNTGLEDFLAFTLITKASGHISRKLYDMFLQNKDRLYISVTCQSIFIRQEVIDTNSQSRNFQLQNWRTLFSKGQLPILAAQGLK